MLDTDIQNLTAPPPRVFTTRTATADPALEATVIDRMPLLYTEGPDPALDRPAHVRAGSGLCWMGDRLALVQDDVNFIAVVEGGGSTVRALVLPAGAGGRRQFDDRRGNKAMKLDLEACAAVSHEGATLVLAFGSGTTPRREQVAIVSGWEEDRLAVQLRHVPALYAALRRDTGFAGGEMNVEGAAQVGDVIRLFGRGNGRPRDGLRPVNATCDLPCAALLRHLIDPDGAPPPAPTAVVRYELGSLDGIPLGFTDACCWGEALLFSAAAEDSPDVVLDGPVKGSVIGVIDENGSVRYAPLTQRSGARERRFAGKVEGLAPRDSAAARLYAVVDCDDPAVPSELCTVELRGAWGE
ncbi:MAG: DUF6929 family protein [Gemmatimonadaceae bacterium]